MDLPTILGHSTRPEAAPRIAGTRDRLRIRWPNDPVRAESGALTGKNGHPVDFKTSIIFPEAV
jgi:hypothetical protein